MSNYFQGEVVILPEMLAAREQRVALQQALLAKCPQASLLSATMNIPGPVKNTLALEKVFIALVETIRKELKDFFIIETNYFSRKTGLEFFLLAEISPELLKRKMIAIEEKHPQGRLVDLDVLWLKDQKIQSISRQDIGFPARRCLICNKDAKVCGRARTHTIEEMQTKIINIIEQGKE
ncbi:MULTISPECIES: citrate lyase holo-[acyl-carrier protein] synthase [Enterococcus]|uniref:citrate lyase holo-[acyl-carrier protein] synthase n=1 Tax=Enterococcus dispar ATCC 51266 TaxID=1139219 RepID=S1NZ38_9ENTE|nr:citrate lyase holo-[acyl-carrier protein] synthase [Enterococcus dispar]EOT38980.1 holo-ACP synthase CitX [Enterococcus dispar ATCC 51266]EOW86119.1 holo-ACP synthase CitX [Enterococcus dispar ATCC 51266]MCU7357038.1 citrate lyase holo-[acyl-carrier protein] synthase [Enterococcus dispar]MDT2705142.1 citrate lyase holo-[acyl-carrier protein] synthase [Enterococcus dispar]WCG32416.1 citrate lyase holo-[acyl-carrier protein] synthase [Enterococcus dispar]